MAETAKTPALQPVSPLAGVAVPGRYGNLGDTGPGVVFRERRDLSILSLVTRDHEAAAGALGGALPAPGQSAEVGSRQVLWAGLDRWYVLAPDVADPELLAALKGEASGSMALADQSHGLTIIEVSGPNVAEVLAKGAPIDLHPDVFGIGQVAGTTMNHLSVHLWRRAADTVCVTVHRSFARDLFEFLTTMALSEGYQVD